METDINPVFLSALTPSIFENLLYNSQLVGSTVLPFGGVLIHFPDAESYKLLSMTSLSESRSHPSAANTSTCNLFCLLNLSLNSHDCFTAIAICDPSSWPLPRVMPASAASPPNCDATEFKLLLDTGANTAVALYSFANRSTTSTETTANAAVTA